VQQERLFHHWLFSKLRTLILHGFQRIHLRTGTSQLAQVDGLQIVIVLSGYERFMSRNLRKSQVTGLDF
jgi:hypothetical protein